MNKILSLGLTTLLALPLFSSCSDVDKIEPVPSTILVPSADVKNLTIVDKDATSETKALYANLWKI